MPAQLDILAIEPFFGHFRRAMLETVVRCSRHRWTLLTLPPRRMERRLSAASMWFAEQLSRKKMGRVDLLFVSEALNLSDFQHRVPRLSRLPSVVYFHDNQLPDIRVQSENKLDFVNLTTATAATEAWFNSVQHLRTFLARANATVQRHPELATSNPMKEMAAKSHVFAPPLDLDGVHEMLQSSDVLRKRRTIYADLHEADLRVLQATCDVLKRRGEQFKLIICGSDNELTPDLERVTVAENDQTSQLRGILEAQTVISTRRNVLWDYPVVRAMAAGCWPILPYSGIYIDLIPEPLQSVCLYDGRPEMLASKLQDVWHLNTPAGNQHEFTPLLAKYNAAAACKAMDERLDLLVGK